MLSRLFKQGVWAALGAPMLVLSTFAMSATDEVPATLDEVAYVQKATSQHYSAGQPTAEQYAEFANHGVRHVVDLRPPQEAARAGLNNAADVSAAGMAYYHIPIAGGEDLTREHVAALDTILQRIGDEPALLHCASGNRVGAMLALHAAWYQGQDVDAALEIGRAYGLTSLEPFVTEAIKNADE